MVQGLGFRVWGLGLEVGQYSKLRNWTNYDDTAGDVFYRKLPDRFNFRFSRFGKG